MIKILIVDDSSVARKMLRRCIPKKKFEVYEAGNGKEAIEIFEKINPDITFMDLTMPVMDGYEAIRHIRKKFGNVRIVVMSADVQKKSIDRVRTLGVFEFLKKPARLGSVQKVLSYFEESVIPRPKEMVHEEEKDILQEIMNIAFGNAAADLAEVIDIYLDLSTPLIHIFKISDMAIYLKAKMNRSYIGTTIITQNFWGDFNGLGILILPHDAGRNLLIVLEESGADDDDIHEKPLASQEREVLLEIGNILIGACVGKVCELLNTFVTYNPPQFVNEEDKGYDKFIDSFDPSQVAIVMETIFQFEQIDIKGQMLIITHQEAIDWLKKALHEFVESYT